VASTVVGRHPNDIAPVFEALNGRADGLYVCADPLSEEWTL
jgi:hypothetical protein